ncbi:MAG: hypothetical protein R3324_06010, partial [Halobacteriales archaeon]|nr:hypothetical protein [Halobacteriales archaeon]
MTHGVLALIGIVTSVLSGSEPLENAMAIRDTVPHAPAPPVAGRTAPAVDADASNFSFAVLGHVRGSRDGGLHYNLDDLLEKVRAREPDFVVLTGDM